LCPRQNGAHGTSHACHTLDTPVLGIPSLNEVEDARAETEHKKINNKK